MGTAQIGFQIHVDKKNEPFWPITRLPETVQDMIMEGEHWTGSRMRSIKVQTVTLSMTLSDVRS